VGESLPLLEGAVFGHPSSSPPVLGSDTSLPVLTTNHHHHHQPPTPTPTTTTAHHHHIPQPPTRQVDLKDKWRNLEKSGAVLRNRNEQRKAVGLAAVGAEAAADDDSEADVDEIE